MPRSIRLKICGVQQPHNLKELVSLSPDYLGFIFYEPSPRYMADTLTPTDLQTVPPHIQKTGVFVNATTAYMQQMAEAYRLNALQLHGNEPPEQCQQLKEKGYHVIKVFSLGSQDFDVTLLEPYTPYVDYFLFDTKGAQPGGNGTTFDWRQLAHYPYPTPFFLSGGISLENVDQLETLASSPLYAIDVNSQFETAPGHKDIGRLKLLVQKLSPSF